MTKRVVREIFSKFFIFIGGHLILLGCIVTILWMVFVIYYASYVYPVHAVTDLTGSGNDQGPHLWWRHHIGEHGDYLTGFFTPVAFSWFVITVFLQRAELIHQRTELQLTREQHKKTAEANENISKSTDRQLVFRMLVDIERIGSSYVVQLSKRFGSAMSEAGFHGRDINAKIEATEAASGNLADALINISDDEICSLSISNSDAVREFLALSFRFSTLFDDVDGLSKQVGLTNYMEDFSETVFFREAHWAARRLITRIYGAEALDNGRPEILS